MNIDGFLLYCSCCGDLIAWAEDTEEKITCECGESGGALERIYVDVCDSDPELFHFQLWGECVPVRFDSFQEHAERVLENGTPLLGNDFRISCWMVTNKSERVSITRYEDEDEFDSETG